MTEVIGVDAAEATESERNMVLACYILHAVGFLTGGLGSVIGVIINHVKINDTTNAFIRSHHRWMIRTFWVGLLCAVVSYALMLVLVGFLTLLITVIWWLYRIVRGVLNFSDRKPMPMDGATWV